MKQPTRTNTAIYLHSGTCITLNSNYKSNTCCSWQTFWEQLAPKQTQPMWRAADDDTPFNDTWKEYHLGRPATQQQNYQHISNPKFAGRAYELMHTWDFFSNSNFQTNTWASSKSSILPARIFWWRGRKEQLAIREAWPYSLFQKLICILEHHPTLKSSVWALILVSTSYIYRVILFSEQSTGTQYPQNNDVFNNCGIALTRRQLSPTTAACVEVDCIASRRL